MRNQIYIQSVIKILLGLIFTLAISTGLTSAIAGDLKFLINFEKPPLNDAQRQVNDPYVDPSTGVSFTAEPNYSGDGVIGLVKNSATSACVEPKNADQKLGTAFAGSDLIGFSTNPIRATFPELLDPPVTVSAEFQTGATTTIQIRLFDELGNVVATASDSDLDPDGTCGYPGDPRARKNLSITSEYSVSYAILEVYPPAYVFVIDNFEYSYGNQPPLADPDGPYLGAVGVPISFDGNGSSDPDGDPLAYHWNFGDGYEGYGAASGHIYYLPGMYDVCLIVNDGGRDSVEVCTTAVVYDPEGGFVTGGGWIWSYRGAYKPDPDSSGWANFGFVSKYQKGAEAPTGQAELVYHTAGMNFHSTSYDWLVVTGSDFAKFKGKGTINGEGDYKFIIWAGDGDPDTFRIKIWEENNGKENVVYDNGADRAIGNGSIVIRDPKEKPISAQCITDWEYHHTDIFATYLLEVDREAFDAYVLDIITLNRFDDSLSVSIKSLSTGTKWSFTEPSCGTTICMYSFDFYGEDGIPLGEGASTYKIEISQDEEGDVKLHCAD